MGFLFASKLDAARLQTRRNQAAAADPAASAWVSANAGTGKTHVLTMRVLRLLLGGTPPERILARRMGVERRAKPHAHACPAA